MQKFEKIQLPIADAFLIKPDVHHEPRGEIWSTYCHGLLDMPFIEDKESYSRRHVLRGLHGDFITHKLVSCLHGAVQFVIADMRSRKPSYGDVWETTLSDSNRWMVLIPPGVLNGHLCMTEDCLFHYKLSTIYTGPDNQISVNWLDDDLAINWAVRTPILSERDRMSGKFKDIIEPEEW